jgi:hypothetical protein
MNAGSDPRIPAASSHEGQAAADFQLEFYKLHRAHEAVLNGATGAYEQSALRLILVLNAAAIAAFLALIQSVGRDSPIRYDFVRARLATEWWAAGAACAFVATVLAYWSQRGYTQAYRRRRQAIEAIRVSDRTILSDVYGVGKEAGALVQEANDRRAAAGKLQYGVFVFGLLAVLASAIGFVNANESIHPATHPVAAPASGEKN